MVQEIDVKIKKQVGKKKKICRSPWKKSNNKIQKYWVFYDPRRHL